MRRLVSCDLKMRPFTLQKRQVLTENVKAKRLTWPKEMLKRIKSGELKDILFTDEKVFTVQRVHNRHNDRVLAKDIQQVPTESKTAFQRQHPASVMVWAGITASGKTPLVFVPPGVKVNKDFYIKHILEDVVTPWAKKKFGKKCWTFMQDGSPTHTAKATQDWIRKTRFWISEQEGVAPVC